MNYHIDIEYNCTPTIKCKGFTKLMYYIINKNNDKIIKNIKKNKTDINAKNSLGWTALMIACKNSRLFNNLEIIKLLLEYGADPNIQNDNGWTALMLTSRFSHKTSTLETVKILLEHNADPNIQHNYGWTALMLSSCFSNKDSNIETIKLLLKYEANPNIQNNDGNTALILSSIYSHNKSNPKTVQLLLQNGAHPNIINKNKYSALLTISDNLQYESDLDVIELLLQYGADTTITNNDGSTSLILISKKSKKYFINLLPIFLRYGKNHLVKDKFGATFINYLNNYYINECCKIVKKFIKTKSLFNKTMKELISTYSEFIFRPTSLRINIISLKWNLDKDYNELKLIYPTLFNYFGIYDRDSLNLKVSPYFSYIY
ncbi:ankyrin repeat protein [Acanthamoeba polyphaga moumouvirus]|uniref:Ankyrin repeat protein n=1 Tax=Acanthamoeba polyphaga moumouvirus TaxID=1269028 RepID=L7RCA8_9VIRU|nr:ankyrin repeat protein [Acanthamoeba polyphaga moumouvirus]AGC01922.1 ankyrin repeat protein [Acanthamoeba polyphaga moumouvirus]AQN68283.1 ankyrin repeat protein [Saudi moumouvirus]